MMNQKLLTTGAGFWEWWFYWSKEKCISSWPWRIRNQHITLEKYFVKIKKISGPHIFTISYLTNIFDIVTIFVTMHRKRGEERLQFLKYNEKKKVYKGDSQSCFLDYESLNHFKIAITGLYLRAKTAAKDYNVVC